MSVVDGTMAVDTLSPIQDSNLFQSSTERDDDQMSDESFNLQLSEDEEETVVKAKRNKDVTRKKEDDRETSTSANETAERNDAIEDDKAVTEDKIDGDMILDKFEDNDNATEVDVDDKLEDKLLNTSDEDCAEKKEEEEEENKVIKNDDDENQIEEDNKDDGLQSESKSDNEASVNKNQDKLTESADATNANNKDSNLISSSEKAEEDMKDEVEEKTEEDMESEANIVTEEEPKDEECESPRNEQNEGQEKQNDDVLKNQIMDTEDLLQIVDKEQPEEDSSGRNSPRSPEDDDAEADKMDVECDDTENDKMECDDEDFDAEENRTVEKPLLAKDIKDIDAVDIDEESNPLKDCDVDIDKEYDNLAASADLDETVDNNETTKNIKEKSQDKEAKEISEELDSKHKDEKEADKDIEMENDSADIEKKESQTEQKEEEIDKSSLLEDNEDNNIAKPAKRSLDDLDASCGAKKLKLNEASDKETTAAPIDNVLEDEKPKKKDANDATPVKEVTPPPAPIKVQVLNAIDEYIKLKALKKLTYNDLEQIILQKICEAICHKSEIGELRHQLGVQEQMVDMWRKEVGQLTKQARDLEIVNKRLLHEVRLRAERDKPLMPVKITRSVGLQVRSDNNSLANATAASSNTNTTNNSNNNNNNNRNVQQRTVNRRQTTPATAASPAKQINSTTNNNIKTNIVRNNLNTNNNRMNPTINKINSNNTINSNNKITINNKNTPVIANKIGTVSKVIPVNVNNTTTIVSKPGPLTPKPIVPKPSTAALQNSTPSTTGNATIHTITSTITPAGSVTSSNTTTPILKSSITSNPKTPAKSTEAKSAVAKSAVIDLTDEDEKRPANTSQAVRIVSAPVKANVTGGNVVNPPRIMYVYNNQLHQGVLSTDPSKSGSPKLMLKLNSNMIGSANGVLAAVSNGSAIAVTTNSSSRANQVQPVRIATTPLNTNTVRANTSITNKTVLKHPAPLPQPPSNQISLPSRKPVPPKPHLSIKRSSNGLILSWKMPYNLDNYESIVSYQLYAYQETSSPPSSEMWRKVGDVKALALPMACTLTQFADGNKYHFAVRAVDVLKRMGAFSDPEQILL